MAQDEQPGQWPVGDGAPRPSGDAAARPGWYPDPWTEQTRRYWTGSQWTSMSFPDRSAGPDAGAARRAGHPDPFATRETAPPAAAPPAPAWVRPDRTGAIPREPAPALAPGAPVPAGRGRWPVLLTALAVLVALVLIGGFVATRGAFVPATAKPSAPPAPSGPSTGPSTPPGPAGELTDLARLGLRQSDVTGPVLVLPIDGGLQVAGETTLDLCDATYPSEQLREDRVQVAGFETDGTTRLSTEAVRYRDAGAVAQAWAEVDAAAAACGHTEPGTTAAPVGAGWTDVTGVRRLAYSLTTTSSTGKRSRYVVVYLSRGNVLLGVYFPHPDGAQLQVSGAQTIPDIVTVFAKRLAALPPSGLPATGPGPSAAGPTA